MLTCLSFHGGSRWQLLVRHFRTCCWSLPLYLLIYMSAVAVCHGEEGSDGIARLLRLPTRQWEDSTGGHQVSARLLSTDAKRTRLKKENGSLVSIATSKLSTRDQLYLESVARLANTEGLKPLRWEDSKQAWLATEDLSLRSVSDDASAWIEFRAPVLILGETETDYLIELNGWTERLSAAVVELIDERRVRFKKPSAKASNSLSLYEAPPRSTTRPTESIGHGEYNTVYEYEQVETVGTSSKKNQQHMFQLIVHATVPKTSLATQYEDTFDTERIYGRLTRGKKPVSHIPVRAVEGVVRSLGFDLVSPGLNTAPTIQTDSQGAFEFKSLPPARYVIAWKEDREWMTITTGFRHEGGFSPLALSPHSHFLAPKAEIDLGTIDLQELEE